MHMPRSSGFTLALAALVLAAAAVAACNDKKDTTPTPVPSTLATSSTPTVASSAAVSATASATASASAEPSATASASAMPDASAVAKRGDAGASGPAASASSGASGAGVCGKKPLPDCPLQGWMKANTSAAMATQDFAKLASALDSTVSLGPPGYGNWASISRDGAKAARDQNIDGVKASCRGCHNQYQTRYRNEMRTRKI